MEVDTDSLINSAIEARSQREAQRQNIGAQRRSIVDQLRATSPRNRGQVHALQSQLSGLDIGEKELLSRDRSDQQLLGTQVSSAFRNASMAHKLSTDALNLQTAQQAGEVFTGFADLMSRTKPGTAAFRDGMTALKDKYPLGFAAEAVKGHLGQISQFHDKEAEQNQRRLAQKLFTDHQISPEQFAQYTNDRATNVPILVNAKGEEDLKNGKPPTHDQIEKLRSNDGSTVAADIGGRTFLFNRDLFDNLKSTFGPNRPTDTSSTERPVTPDQNNGIQPLVSTYGGQGAAPPGGLVRNYDGSITPIVPTYGGEGAAPPGALVRTGVAQIGTPPPTGVPKEEQIIQSGSATVPHGVQPNQPLQPVAQLGTQPMVDAPQVAQQPTATPHPMEGQTVRNKTSGQMGTITNGIFVPDQQ